MVLPGFYSGFGGQELETTEKTRKNHQNSILRDSLKMVVFLVFLGVYSGLLWFLMGFSWFYMVLVVELETTVKTRKNHQNSILRDNLKMVVFLVFLGFDSGFGVFLWLLVVFFVSFTIGLVVSTSKPR